MSLLTVPNIFGTNPKKVFANEWNNNFLAITNALSGIHEGVEFRLTFQGATPVLKLNQKGSGYILRCLLNAQYVCGINNLGQIESVITGNISPLIVASSTKVNNLNVDAWDNLYASNILKLVGGILTGFLTTHANPDADMKLANKQYVDSKSFFPSGTKILFGTEPPSGWVRVDNADDRMIKLAKVAEVAGNAGSDWFVSGISLDNTVLTLNQIPSHLHSFTYAQALDTDLVFGGADIIFFTSTGSVHKNTTTTGSNAAHNHSISSYGSWRPRYEIWCGATRT